MTAPLPLAEPSDLGVWLGQTIASGDARAVAVLAGASALVRAHAGRTWMNDAGDALADVPDAVKTVVVQVAGRVWVNPQGLVRADGGEATGRQWAPSAAEGLFLTSSEKTILAAFTTGTRSGLWSLRTVRDDCYPDTTYVPVEGTDTPFPWYADDVDQHGLHP